MKPRRQLEAEYTDPQNGARDLVLLEAILDCRDLLLQSTTVGALKLLQMEKTNDDGNSY